MTGYNWQQGSQEAPEFEQAPPGDYNLLVKQASFQQTKNGDGYTVKMDFKILHPQHKDEFSHWFLVKSSKAGKGLQFGTAMFNRACSHARVPADFQLEEVNRYFQGKTVPAILKHEQSEYNGETYTNLRVKEIIKLDDVQSPTNAVTAAPPQSDIPPPNQPPWQS